MRTSSAAIVVAACMASGPAAAQSVHRQHADIRVGENVHISKARGNLVHYENLAAGDLGHAGRFISCIHVYPRGGVVGFEQQCYDTFDGKTWGPSLRIAAGTGNGDPTVAYGRGDTVYVVSLVLGDTAQPDSTKSRTRSYRSPDGGHTWEQGGDFAFIDREFVSVDRTGGQYAGRVYVVGQGSVRNIAGASGGSSLQLYRSLDGGRSFAGPVHAQYPTGSIIFGVGTAAVLSDGTYVVLFGITKPGRSQSLEQEPSAGPNAELHVITSKDGGETFTASHKVADIRLDRPRAEGGILNQLAADPGSKAFRDRIYVAYPAIRDGRIQVHVSYSADTGKTWSTPVVVNDDRSPEEEGKGPDHILPAIAVNRDGVVLVTWYDRRDERDDLGWRMRAATSLDGGESFSESVPVATAANSYSPGAPWDVAAGVRTSKEHVSITASIDPFYINGGHTTGLATDASGVFYPTWVDNRTGVAQLWGAPVTVGGTVARHGAPELADLEDISSQVKFDADAWSFDHASGRLVLTVRLRNASKDTIVGPVKLRVRTLESALGVPEILNADNGEHGTGAVWDLSGVLDGGVLRPGMRSRERTLEFRVASLRGLKGGRAFKWSVLNADAGVYGKVRKPAPLAINDRR